MTTEVYETLKAWILRVSLAIACIIGLLSLLAGIKLISSVVRAGVTCLLFYLLLTAILTVFQKTALPEPEVETGAESVLNGRGGVIDFSVGDSEGSAERLFPGQIDPDIIGDGKHAAEVVRKMGWE